ncbi:MAG: hypothetical protein RIB67_04735 [Miltoncostaeaceae bacterium]
MAPTPDTVLAALPRVVRVADETRWRGQAALGTAIVLAIFWSLTWLLGEPVERVRTPVGFMAVAAPTLLVAGLASRRRVANTLAVALPTPRGVVHETVAHARDRRMRLATVVLFGIILLLVFDRFTGGGGMMAGLVAGLMLATGIVDLLESRLWRHEERTRAVRLFVLVRPRALTPALSPEDVFQAPDSGSGGPIEMPLDAGDLP